MKICIILGTRPEIIKMAPIIRECEKKHADYFVLHTGQHYSINMDKIFFDELKLPQPGYNLDVGSGTHAKQTADMLVGIENVLLKEKPDIVLVEGDTNTVLAGSLAASKLHILVGHVEAGLRSYDRNMPEEINRILSDHVSDYLFAPTEKAKSNLLSEGIPANKIFVTGNTIVDSVLQHIKLVKEKSDVLKNMNLKKDGYILMTAHRQENVDVKNRLKGIFDGLKIICKEYRLPVIFPIHPRTRKRMEAFGLKETEGIVFTEPVGFLDFLELESNARLVLTDSGGVQEETCILNVPCVTLRDNTERPETIDVGSNMLAGTTPEKIRDSVRHMISKKTNWKNPFGDGKAALRILSILDKMS
ncbi:UDP-N-acetylglucosamine 2-epimerase [uncultured archaeon]|nr:UDP-N-acetylglucosamine 2-epimerase [uncultured archaeon]